MPAPRKPNHLKVVTGTDQPCRMHAPDWASFDSLQEFPPPPQTLNTDGAEMWGTLGPRLLANRLLTVVDLYALQQLCYCWQRHVTKQRAGMDITAAEDNALKGLYAEFGITPRARQAVAGKQIREEDKPSNPFGQVGKKPEGRKR